MLVEIANALFVAFVATEILILHDGDQNAGGGLATAAQTAFAQPLTRRIAVAACATNVVDFLLHAAGVRAALVALAAPLHAAAGWPASRALVEACVLAFAGASLTAALGAASRRGWVPKAWNAAVVRFFVDPLRHRGWKAAAAAFAALWLLVFALHAVVGGGGDTGGDGGGGGGHGLVLGAAVLDHTPRVVFVLAGFMALCYWDCRRLRGGGAGLGVREFAGALGRGLAFARRDSAEDFSRLDALLFTAMAWSFIPAYCFA